MIVKRCCPHTFYHTSVNTAYSNGRRAHCMQFVVDGHSSNQSGRTLDYAIGLDDANVVTDLVRRCLP